MKFECRRCYAQVSSTIYRYEINILYDSYINIQYWRAVMDTRTRRENKTKNLSPRAVGFNIESFLSFSTTITQEMEREERENAVKVATSLMERILFVVLFAPSCLSLPKFLTMVRNSALHLIKRVQSNTSINFLLLYFDVTIFCWLQQIQLKILQKKTIFGEKSPQIP